MDQTGAIYSLPNEGNGKMSTSTAGNFELSPHAEVGAVTLRVQNIDRMGAFYDAVMGFNPVEKREDMVEMTVPDGKPLVQLVSDPGAEQKPVGTAGLYHFAVLLPERQALALVLQRLIDRRYPLQGAADHFVSEAVYLADPEGNGIEVYADRSSEVWQDADGGLRMGTVALDVDDLLSEIEGNQDRSDDLPDGTKLGHIHLHVAELESSVQFYRDVLGFDLMMRYGGSAAFLSVGGYHHHIGLNTWAGVGAPPKPPGSTGLVEFTVELPEIEDLDRLAASAQSASIDYERQDGLLSLMDPSENRIVFKKTT